MRHLTAGFLVAAFIYILIGAHNAIGINFSLSEASEETQTTAVKALISRTIGANVSKHFLVEIDKNITPRSYKITKIAPSTICIQGSDGISAAKGFHHYLKYHLNEDVDWTRSRINLPTTPYLPNVTVFSTSASDIIYYQNVCTWSYSFAWWRFSTWRQHIDWMAMMGVTLTIAPIQEDIWHGIYLDMGLTENDINMHFAGPAFQAWQRMGNIRGWGGPIPHTYRQMQKRLQQKIIKAQRELGMRVALPAFAGHVPSAMRLIYPKINFTSVERWNHFPDTYCCGLFLDPNELLFHTIATEFLRRTIDSYGSDNIYFCDPFNEIQPRLADADYMKSTAFHIFDSMQKVDEEAIWLLQGWMFVKNIFWTDDLIKAFLTAVPRGKMLVLDLQSEQFPQYERTYFFHGQPFIWCMLHNFGGTLGMHGSVDIVNTRIREARNMKNSSMVGVGITPEGIHQNYVMYALALERAWLKDDIDLDIWFDNFTDIRYGVQNTVLRKAWQLLRKSVYSFKGIKKIRGKYTITMRPSINLKPWTWYNESYVYRALNHFLIVSNSSFPVTKFKVYEHDLVDLTRQFLQVIADRLFIDLMSSYRRNQLNEFTREVSKFLSVFDDLESILATHEEFLLGRWLKSAKRMGRSPLEKQLFEMNARNQITGWGPNGQIVDYATKQWAGIIQDYYLPRWVLFLNSVKNSLELKKKFNEAKFRRIVKQEIENPFTISTKFYSTNTTGDTVQIARDIFNKWSFYFND